MNYAPRYVQPFTLEQAILLDVPIITEGQIARLQNSLQHLKQTQEELRQHVASTSSPDQEFTEAIDENELVIGSQEERIGILRLALTHKGIPTNGHYDPQRPTSQSQSSTTNVDGNVVPAVETLPEDDEGIHL